MRQSVLSQNKNRIYAFVLVILMVLSNARVIEAQTVMPSIRKVLLCETISGYGKYVERSSTVAPEDLFYVYSESTVQGIPKPGGNYSIQIQFAMKIFDPLGMIAQTSKSAIINYESPRQEVNYYWSHGVDVSKFLNLINGEHVIKFELTDRARNLTTSVDRKFTLAAAYPSDAVMRLNQTIVLKNILTSGVSTINILSVANIPNVVPYQTVLEGPRISITPQSQMVDGYGNRYSLFRDLKIGPGSNLVISLSYVVSVKMMKMISQRAIPFVALQSFTPEIQKYLHPTSYIESDDSVFKQITNEFRAKSDDVLELIYLIHNFTANHVAYDNGIYKDPVLKASYEKDSALTTYSKGKGLCTNFARLMVALLRSAGIPARTVGGFGFMSTVPYKTFTENMTHMWTEVYLPSIGWIPVEPQSVGTLGFTLSSHLLYVWSDTEYNYPISGGYDASIEDVTYWYTPSGSPPAFSESMSHVETLPSAQYKPRYYLKLSTEKGVASGEGWYDYGKDVQFSVSAPEWVFDGWYDKNGNLITTSLKGSIVMDHAYDLQAKWQSTPSNPTTPGSNPGTMVLFFAALLLPTVAVAVLYVRRRRKLTESQTACNNANYNHRRDLN